MKRKISLTFFSYLIYFHLNVSYLHTSFFKEIFGALWFYLSYSSIVMDDGDLFNSMYFIRFKYKYSLVKCLLCKILLKVMVYITLVLLVAFAMNCVNVIFTDARTTLSFYFINFINLFIISTHYYLLKIIKGKFFSIMTIMFFIVTSFVLLLAVPLFDNYNVLFLSFIENLNYNALFMYLIYVLSICHLIYKLKTKDLNI
ncbi:hypothetical protein LL065_24865 (plasmid) [Clostridium estertheticum]|uniref:hypothetical protein n=1 Tax=Clostridium estertheticum TaxID=238834 RepID=UPI00227B9B61|nr:hypothetical protein [Clostridium estertheticum]WAG43639.1 hypothetical protein LL065_24865 [Clostridium estertheticum]